MAIHIDGGSVVPIIAVFLSLCRAFAPVPDVWRARKEQSLNELNLFPFAAAILNCAGWVVYTVIISNVYVFLSDAPGLMAATWMLFSLYPLANKQVQDEVTAFLVFAGALWTCLGFATIILKGETNGHAIKPMWGYCVSATQVVLMASPLSTIVKAIRERCCDSFHPGLCIMGFVMSAFWGVYAVVIKDNFILIPNVLGAAVALASVLVCLLLPRGRPGNLRQEQEMHARQIEQS